MNDRETNIYDALPRMREFNERNNADYKQFADAATHFAIISMAIDSARKPSGNRDFGRKP